MTSEPDTGNADPLAETPEKQTDKVTIHRTKGVDEALKVITNYLETFKNHADGRVNNGTYYILANDKRLATFAVVIAAELLVKAGYVEANLSWLEPTADD